MKLTQSLPHAVGHDPSEHLVFLLCTQRDDSLQVHGVGAVDFQQLRGLPDHEIAEQIDSYITRDPACNSIVVLTTGARINGVVGLDVSNLLDTDVFLTAHVDPDGTAIPAETYEDTDQRVSVVTELLSLCAAEAVLHGNGSYGSRQDIEAAFTRKPVDHITLEQFEALGGYQKATPHTLREQGQWLHEVLTKPDVFTTDRMLIIHACSDKPTRDWTLMLLTSGAKDINFDNYVAVFPQLLDAYVHAPNWTSDHHLSELLAVIALAAWQSGRATWANVALEQAEQYNHISGLGLLLRRAVGGGHPPELWWAAMKDLTEEQIVASIGGVTGPAL